MIYQSPIASTRYTNMDILAICTDLELLGGQCLTFTAHASAPTRAVFFPDEQLPSYRVCELHSGILSDRFLSFADAFDFLAAQLRTDLGDTCAH